MTGERHAQKLSLSESAEYLLEECRMVLPGIQALFGFQLIAVFSPGFEAKLAHGERLAHLIAIILVSISIALVMAPAAYHRLAGSGEVSDEFVALSTRLLLCGMVPLALAITIDLYLVARVIDGKALASGVAMVGLSAFVMLWFYLPHRWRAARIRARK